MKKCKDCIHWGVKPADYNPSRTFIGKVRVHGTIAAFCQFSNWMMNENSPVNHHCVNRFQNKTNQK